MSTNSSSTTSTSSAFGSLIPHGMVLPSGERVSFRAFGDDVDVAELTRLLRAAYGPLAELGLRFTATWQDDDLTLERASKGTTTLAMCEGAIVGTITLVGPDRAEGCEWYERGDVATLHQYAVEPRIQGLGVGRRLLALAELQARKLGARELALDTAEPARDLVAMYEALGFRRVGHAQWGTTNYRSVIMSRTL